MGIFLYPSEIYAKILGLDICANTLVGDEMLKGISGGQKKRLTTGTSFLLVDIRLFKIIEKKVKKALLGLLKL